jgi:uncharacterized membrane protein YqjE
MMDDEPRPTQATAPPPTTDTDASLGTLFRELAEDTRALVRQELTLAKLEVKENVTSLLKDMVLIVIGAGMALLGLLVLTAFLVLGLGRLLGGEYWLSALIVGGVLAALGVVTAYAGTRGLSQDSIAPEQTMETIRENKEWASTEIRQVTRDLAS